MKIFAAFLLLVLPALVSAQHIVYSTPETEDGRRTNFEIIGRINGNVLVFKNNRNDNAISVYDNDMKLVSREKISFLPEKYINVDFINYPDYSYMIYEYQHKNIVHCAAVKLDGLGKKVGEPVDLDTTQIGFAATNKIYTTVFSEDKQRIMIFKINSRNPKQYVFTTFLFDANLQPLDRHRMTLPMEERNDMFTDFLLDNEGELVFCRFQRNNSSDYITKVNLVTKSATADSFSVRDIGAGDRILDELKLKADNSNRRYIITGFYYKQRRGNIEGLFTAIWDKATDAKLRENLTVFSDQLRSLAKSSDASLKMAFNDFFIQNVIVQKDGGYVLVGESTFTTSRGGPFNRWDYLYGYNPYLSGPIDYYYSPYYGGYSPWNRYGGYGSGTRYHAENIMILSFDKDGNLSWSNVIPKSQFDDDNENLISYHIMNTGGELHFLYNQYDRRTLLMTDQSVSPDGKITRYPTLKNLDKGYDFMPRYGKQVSSRVMVIPCLYRNYLCFARVEF